MGLKETGTSFDFIRDRILNLDEGIHLTVSQNSANKETKVCTITQGDEVHGLMMLSFNRNDNICFFDVAVGENGTGIGTKTLTLLAKKLTSYDYRLVTSIVMPTSKKYWEELVKKGIAEPFSEDETNYLIVAKDELKS